MTTHYFDCSIITSDSDAGMMMSKLFTRIHGYLVENKLDNVGLSFPAYTEVHPGRILRLFSDESTLENIKSNEGIELLERTYALVRSEIKRTPEICRHAIFKRMRKFDKSSERFIEKSTEKLIKKLEKKKVKVKKKILEKRASILKKRFKEKIPYLRVKSRSTEQGYSVFIGRFDNDNEKIGKFSGYGLSSNFSTVPVF